MKYKSYPGLCISVLTGRESFHSLIWELLSFQTELVFKPVHIFKKKIRFVSPIHLKYRIGLITLSDQIFNLTWSWIFRVLEVSEVHQLERTDFHETLATIFMYLELYVIALNFLATDSFQRREKQRIIQIFRVCRKLPT